MQTFSRCPLFPSTLRGTAFTLCAGVPHPPLDLSAFPAKLSMSDLRFVRQPEFKDNIKKNNAWGQIGEEMQINKAEVQTKLRNLTSQLYRESKKAKSGSGEDSESKWFAFENHQFMRDKTTPQHSRE
ncbi:hypothetical protein PR048_007881 [Dryococelus australis]|uniref:MADF domain-containing protein n=1 Tax=Dryococelus australis TaxID=614101 RepID=A0ABQ9HVI5_9NEOP|nr:hypothetical protein PR048_007881 [Dryococelus australis]